MDYSKTAPNGMEYCFGTPVHVEVGIYSVGCAWTGAQALGPVDDFGFVHDVPPRVIGAALHYMNQAH